MSLSSHSEGQIRDSEGKEYQQQQEELFEMPLIVLSSSSSELSPEIQPHSSRHEDPYEETVIQAKRESENQRQKRINSVKHMWDEVQEREKKEYDDIRKNPPRRQSSQPSRQRQIHLKKEFPTHTFLSYESLEFVQECLENFPTHPYCQFENKDDLSEQTVKIRQSQRQNLTRAILLARQQLKLLKQMKTQFQQKICKNSTYALRYAYTIASNIQINFYKKLYNKRKNKKGGSYLNQIKVVLRQFADKNNIEFRRAILSSQFKMAVLVRATEEQLMCEKSKQEKEERMKQIIRESQKIEEKPVISIDQQVLQGPIDSLQAIASIKSTSEFYQDKPETAQERKTREKDDLIAKNKIICKKTYKQITKAMKEMRERTERLKMFALDKGILQKMKFDLNVSMS